MGKLSEGYGKKVSGKSLSDQYFIRRGVDPRELDARNAAIAEANRKKAIYSDAVAKAQEAERQANTLGNRILRALPETPTFGSALKQVFVEAPKKLAGVVTEPYKKLGQFYGEALSGDKYVKAIQQNNQTINAWRNLVNDPKHSEVAKSNIKKLMEDNAQLANEAGGEIKNQTTKQLAGLALEIGADIGTLGIGGSLIKGGKVVPKLAGLALEAGGTGAAFGAAGAMQQDKGAGEIAKSAAIGAGVGLGTLGAGLLAKKAGTKVSEFMAKRGAKEVTEEIAPVVEKTIPEAPKTPQVAKETVGEAVEQVTTKTPVEAKIEVPVTTKPIKEVIGTTKESGYAKSLEVKAVEKKMADNFQDLAEYTPGVRKQQAEAVSNLINSDIARVKRIIAGKEDLPSDIKAGSLALGVEQFAAKNKDVDLLRSLASSKISSQISEAGSELSMLVGRNANEPANVMRKIAKLREENLLKRLKSKDVGKVRRMVRSELKEKIRKEIPKKETWDSFIANIEC